MNSRVPSFDQVAWAFQMAPGGDGSSRSPVPSAATTCVFAFRPELIPPHIQYAIREPFDDQLGPARSYPGSSWTICLILPLDRSTEKSPRLVGPVPLKRISPPSGGR